MVAIIAAFIFEFAVQTDMGFWTNFSFAVFGSALLRFIMSLVEYFVIKKKAFEEYYSEVVSLIGKIEKVNYFIFKEPKKL